VVLPTQVPPLLRIVDGAGSEQARPSVSTGSIVRSRPVDWQSISRRFRLVVQWQSKWPCRHPVETWLFRLSPRQTCRASALRYRTASRCGTPQDCPSRRDYDHRDGQLHSPTRSAKKPCPPGTGSCILCLTLVVSFTASPGYGVVVASFCRRDVVTRERYRSGRESRAGTFHLVASESPCETAPRCRASHHPTR
jgi:hypothetical protein